MLVPAITSTGIRFSSSHLITPTCANPSAPPPSSTRPIRGRWLPAAAVTAFAGGWATPTGVSCAKRQRLDKRITIMQTAKLQGGTAPLVLTATLIVVVVAPFILIAPPKRAEILRCHVSPQKNRRTGFANSSELTTWLLLSLYSCDAYH